ncbi:avermectin biosynthesis spirocyclase AveC [Streptomyces avermitilis]|uniref:avermectin biosynthesis spirocyclase AveC n=1 Tax=Streptomyces avermitilis TaxID=33903 RepID=UPI0033A34ACB
MNPSEPLGLPNERVVDTRPSDAALSSEAGLSRSGVLPRELLSLPVVVWAGVGLLFLALQAYVFGRWAADGGYRLIETAGQGQGGSRQTGTTDVVYPVISVLCITAAAVWLFQKCRVERRLLFDALLFLGLLFASWQSPLMNWFHSVLVSNASVWGAVGSWGPYVPGWQGAGPGAEAEMPLASASVCMSALIVTVLCSKALGWIKARRPAWRTWRLVVAVFFIGVVLGLSEPLPSASGISVWARALPEVTLWSGEWYQFPMYQAVGSGLVCCMLGSLRFFRDERDESWVERGAWRLPQRAANWARFLAVVGGVNAVMFVYTCFHILLSLIGGQPPAQLPDSFQAPAAY